MKFLYVCAVCYECDKNIEALSDSQRKYLRSPTNKCFFLSREDLNFDYNKV